MRAFFVAAFLLMCLAGNAVAQNVYIARAASVPEARYASRRLGSALVERGYTVVGAAHADACVIHLAIKSSELQKEAFAIRRNDCTLSVYGGDPRGLIYGALAVAEDLRNGVALRDVRARAEKPQLQFRGIKYDLPWDSYRASMALSQHMATVRDLAYWESFLDMMVENRFNVLTLSSLHPWTYMVRPRHFPEASRFNDKEMAEWQRLHHGILRMARERGIETYVVPWNIFVSPEFAKAHNVGLKNTYPYYNTTGDTSEVIKQYVRECVAQVLEEYPELTGVGLSVAEGMGGMTPEERQKWLDETYVSAIRSVKRPVKIIRTEAGSGSASMDGTTSVDAERLMRSVIEKTDYAAGPIWLTQKFNWSHGHSSTTLVLVHGGKLGDAYFKPEPSNYKVVWIMRNEDFFALRWGVPSFVRQHIKLNGTKSYVGGYLVGSETYIPALDYFTPADMKRSWKYAFERQWLFYKLWGRLLYSSDTPDSVFADEFARRYGPKGQNLLRAYELASATPLRLASLFQATWDHTLYSEGMMVLDGRSMAHISTDRLIAQPVLDPAYVSISDYVDAEVAGRAIDADRITPPKLADKLESGCREALRLVDGIDTSGNVALMYEVADIKTWTHLGLHLAEKIRGGVALQKFRKMGGEENKAQAVSHLQSALAQWDEVISITRPIYRDMWLTHMIGKSNALNPDAMFHWQLLRPMVVQDLEAAGRAEAPSGVQ